MPDNWLIPLSPALIAHDLMSIGDAFSNPLKDSFLRYGEHEIEVVGTLPVAESGPDRGIVASCNWRISRAWQIHAPTVFCRSKWLMKTGVDWHVYADGSLCYIHPRQWRNCVLKLVSVLAGSELRQVFAQFAYNNLRWLLQRHLEAYRWNLSTWPPEWPQWLHGAEGDEQYLRDGESMLRQVTVRSLPSN